jgi:Fur family transcriptional regulator, peroxide stress response regulator
MRHIEQNKKAPLERLETSCRQAGLPVTVQRRVIFSALLERGDHPTVDQIFAQVKDRIPGVSRTTVYRTLETLATLGLVRRTNHFAASARYDGNIEQHHHLVCTACGKVIDFQDSTVTVSNLPDGRRNGFTMIDYSIYFEGFCADCKRSSNSPKPREAKGRPR